MYSKREMTSAVDSSKDQLSSTQTNAERLEHLVQVVNAKFAAIQRRDSRSPPNTPALHEFADRTPSEAKFPSSANSKMGSPHLRPSQSAMDASITASILSGTSRWHERELFVAASDLCLYLNGGVNYRVMCLRYHRTLEILMMLLREDICMARKVDIVPNGTLEKIHTLFTSLLHETKSLLVDHQLLPATALVPKEETHALPMTLAVSGGGHVSPNVFRTEHQPSLSVTNPSNRSSRVRMVEKAEASSGDGKEEYYPLHFNAGHINRTPAQEDYFDVPTPIKVNRREPSVSCDGPQVSFFTHRRSTNCKRTDETTPSPQSTNNFIVSTLTEQLENLYRTEYKYDGMRMMAAVMRLVFSEEFESDGEESKAQEGFFRFKNCFNEHILPCMESLEAFKAYTTDQTSLRSEYVMSCLHHSVQPNSLILDQLSSLLSEVTTTTLMLSNANLGDSGVKPLTVILPRLQHLRFLHLGHNQLHDDSLRDICQALQHHSALEVMDLSGNPLTDAAGADLLRLAESATQLKMIGQESLSLSPPVQEALRQQLQHNQRASHASWTSAQQLLHGFIGQRGVTPMETRSLTPRLDPVGMLPELGMPRGTSLPVPQPPSMPCGLRSPMCESTGRSTFGDSQLLRGMVTPHRIRLPYLTAGRRHRRVTPNGNANVCSSPIAHPPPIPGSKPGRDI